MSESEIKTFKDLVGQTLAEVINTGDEIQFTLTDGRKFHLWHQQDCCEHVRVEDVCGDLSNLVGTPLLQAEESDSQENPPQGDYTPESFTWTFYRLATIKGSVVIRFYGESNGYYSESVDFSESK